MGAVHFRNHAGISGTMIQELGRVISGTRIGHFRNQDRSFQELGSAFQELGSAFQEP